MAMAAAPLVAVTPIPVAIVGEGGRQRRESESNANKTAERDNFGLAHGLLLPGGADKLHPSGAHASTSRTVTQRNRSVLLQLHSHGPPTVCLWPAWRDEFAPSNTPSRIDTGAFRKYSNYTRTPVCNPPVKSPKTVELKIV